MPDQLAVALPVLVSVAGFLVLWWVVLALIARFDGWAALAAVYAAPDYQPLTGAPCWRWQSAVLGRSSRYNGSLRFCADPRGLGIVMMVLFRPGHAPLLVPWSEIAARAGGDGWGVELRFRRVPAVTMRIPPRLGEAIAAAAGRALRYEPAEAAPQEAW